MSKSDLSKRLRFWLRFTLFAGVASAGLYFVLDPTTPKIYKLLIAAGLFGLVLYYFLGGGGGKGDGWNNDKGPQSWWYVAGD